MAEDIGAAFFSDGCEITGSALEGEDDRRRQAAAFAFSGSGSGGWTTTATATAALPAHAAAGNSTAGSDGDCGSEGLIESFAVFGGAFLMRPIGALLFGYIGDTYGRKRALELSVQMMCITTVVMGCLPTYKQAGIAAPLLLCFVRYSHSICVLDDIALVESACTYPSS